MSGHASVLLNEVVEWLDPVPGETLVDGTLGRAGHAAALLEKLGPKGRLIGLDKDPEAVEAGKDALARFGASAVITQADFGGIEHVLSQIIGIGKVDGMLLDLGVSSPQLDQAGRGFSFRQDGPLDMRMDPGAGLTAEEIVNRWPEEKIREILWELGEERMSRQIAGRIVEARRKAPIRTTKELENVIFHAVPKAMRFGRIHPATRSFQALRIAVNGELEALEKFLKDAPARLAEGARLAVISFHSLEDRIVKQTFKQWEKDNMGKVMTKKPIEAGEGEQEANPRSRSAKLRVFEKGAA